MGFGGRCAALAFLVLSAAIPALARAAPPKPASADFAAQADRYIREKADTGVFSGSVLIAYDGRVLLRRAYGLANRELNAPAQPQSEYALASMSKTFTAVAVLQLVQAGKLGLDDPIAKFIPDAPAAW